jgi:hypothetical protein
MIVTYDLLKVNRKILKTGHILAPKVSWVNFIPYCLGIMSENSGTIGKP